NVRGQNSTPSQATDAAQPTAAQPTDSDRFETMRVDNENPVQFEDPSRSRSTSIVGASDGTSTGSSMSAKPEDPGFEQQPQDRAPGHPADKSKAATFFCEAADCNKAYIRHGDLDRHRKSHGTGPKAYDCCVARCPRKGYKGFWRIDKLKDHLDCKHPEVEVERWYKLSAYGQDLHDQESFSSRNLSSRPFSVLQGFRDVTRREEHEALMRSRGFAPHPHDPRIFRSIRESVLDRQ
ncbi:MAG: hypothetical protein Q9196_007415, partial [Gyalolechia fulgens]